MKKVSFNLLSNLFINMGYEVLIKIICIYGEIPEFYTYYCMRRGECSKLRTYDELQRYAWLKKILLSRYDVLRPYALHKYFLTKIRRFNELPF